MNSIWLGFTLMAIGVLLLVFGNSRAKNRSVHASHGSVAVGGDNKGSIANVNIGSAASSGNGRHTITWIGIVVEIVGIAVTIWHASHLIR